MRKLLYISPLLWLLKASAAKAICPVCTVTVVAATGLSRWLGLDDTITGLWIGGLTVSMIYWTIEWLEKKQKRFKYDRLVVTIGYYATIYASLLFGDVMFHPANRIWGIDKLFLGMVVGSIFFLGSALTYEYLKAKNNGHAYFPYQKVAMPVGTLLVLSGIFYLIVR